MDWDKMFKDGTFINGDCMEYMRQMPDNAADLAIVDPPYGIGNIIRHKKGGNQKADNFHFDDGKDMSWNNNIPKPGYFHELQRVSKNQIIWGGNYYANLLDNSKCWIIWDKLNGGSSFADAELAWTSFNKVVSIYKFRWHGMIQGNMKNKETRIHPTQKPVQLYKWILHNYAKPNMKIIDTHVGSASSIIAFLDYGCDWIGFEIDPDYHKSGSERIEIHKQQLKLF